MTPKILFEDAHIIVCEKPAGMPVQPDRSLSMDMVNYLKNHLFQQTKKQPELFVVHRLDRPVGGLMVFAKTKKAAAFLSSEFQNKKQKPQSTTFSSNSQSKEPHSQNPAFSSELKEGLSKRYLAVITALLPVSGQPQTLVDYLKKDGRTNLSSVVSKEEAGAKKAVLHYRVLGCNTEKELSLIEVDLVTGRHHQIRVQTAFHLGGIYGDKKYNPKASGTGTLEYPALCSYALSFLHPESREKMEFRIRPGYSAFAFFGDELFPIQTTPKQ